MAIKKSLFLLFIGFITFSFLLIALPTYVNAEQDGCCQYSNGDDLIGCQDVASSDSCDEDSTNPNKKYFPNGECGMKTGLCTGSKEENPEEKGFGCCQMFFGEDPGCMYPSTVGSCTGENRTFVETNECSEDGYCKGYKKE